MAQTSGTSPEALLIDALRGHFPPVPVELQHEFDAWEQVSDEDMARLDPPRARARSQFGQAQGGKGYLTFATYHYIHNVLGQPVELYGVDKRAEPLASHRAKAAKLGWEGLTFAASSIAEFEPPRVPDLVLSLHACDTATDDAIARAIQWRSRYVLSVPCCHHDLQQQLRSRDDMTALKPICRFGVLAERLGDVLTDTFRALILRICGYRCDVVEFVSSEHTAKNLMIRAARAGRIGDAAAVEDYVRLRDHLGVRPFLERLLGQEFQDLLHSARLGLEAAPVPRERVRQIE